MRKARIYFLVDTSRYMIGSPIRKIEEIIKACIQEGNVNPSRNESRFYSIITFGNSEVKEYLPITSADKIIQTPIQFACSKERRFLDGLDLLKKKLEEELLTPAYEDGGDFVSGLFIFTGGLPEDEMSEEQLTFLTRAFQTPFSDKNGTYLILFSNEYVKKRYQEFFTKQQLLDIENLHAIKEAFELLHDRHFAD